MADDPKPNPPPEGESDDDGGGVMVSDGPGLPAITHWQFLMLNLLRDRELSGRELRGELDDAGLPKSGPNFYQFMGRLEDAGLVDGRYDVSVDARQPLRERYYCLTEPGRRAWQAVRDFYVAQLKDLQRGG
jgi:DNA-binding PadR family transcriptional regulator